MEENAYIRSGWKFYTYIVATLIMIFVGSYTLYFVAQYSLVSWLDFTISAIAMFCIVLGIALMYTTIVDGILKPKDLNTRLNNKE